MSYTPLQKLGFDSTVFRVRDIDGRLQYLFGFYHHNRPSGSDTVYQTTRALNESEAEYPGYDHKCMRVFEVHRITKFAHDPQERQLAERPAVLRDFWQRDEHTPRERVKQRAIIDVLKREGVWAEMKGKFMGIPEDGGVHYPPTIGVHVRPDPLARRPKGLRHYRGVYTQLCIDLYQVDNPALFFRALSQVVRILQYFKRVGYLHGDVSMGNFLLHHVTGRLPISLGGISRKDIKDWNVIVSDLEFSRTYPCKDEPYPFGTRLFMSTEWRQSCYKHTDGTDDASKPLNDPTHKRNFVYNFYHDLECVLWMAMYYVLERVPQKRLSSVPDIRAVMIEIESRDNLSQYFYDDASPLRFGLIENEAGSIGLRHRLRNFYYDDTHGPLLDVLSLARDMRAAYRAVENGWTAADTIKLDDGRTVFAPARFADAIYDKLADAFRGVSEYYLDHPDVFIITPPRPPKPPFSGIPKLRIPVRPEWELAQPKYGDLNEGPCECDECVREAQPVPPTMDYYDGERARREHLYEDYGHCTEFFTDMDLFFEAYMPQWKWLSEDDCEAVIQYLRAHGLYNFRDRWDAFHRKLRNGGKLRSWQRPSDLLKLQRLRGFANIVSRTLEAAEKHLPQRFSTAARTTIFKCGLPDRPLPDSISEDENVTADAAFVRVDGIDTTHVRPGGAARMSNITWLDKESFALADTAASGALTVGDDIETKIDLHENAERVICHARDVFSNDKGHLAVFSFTIEQKYMRIWCHTHTRTVVSPAFDMDLEPDTLVNFILFMSYSPLHHLGFDPTVRRVKDIDGKLQYHFRFESEESYETTTYQTTRAIAIPNPEYPGRDYKSMTVYEVKRVLHNAEDPKDRVLREITNVLRDFWDQDDSRQEIAAKNDVEWRMSSVGIWSQAKRHFMDIPEDGVVQYPLNTEPPSAFRILAHFKYANCYMWHYRGVYTQLCVDMHHVDNPVIFFHGLSQTLAQWTTIVSDLEYARPYYDCPENEGQIVPDPSHATNFVSNFYHELESALWMAFDFVIRRISQDRLLSELADAERVINCLRTHREEMFPETTYGSVARHRIIDDGWTTRLRRDLGYIYGNTHPILEILRLVEELRTAYTKAESQKSQTKVLDDGRTVYALSVFTDEIYDEMERTFRKISDHFLDEALNRAPDSDPDVFIRLPPRAPPFNADWVTRRGIPRCPAWQLAESKNFDNESEPEEPVALRTRKALKREAEELMTIPTKRAREDHTGKSKRAKVVETNKGDTAGDTGLRRSKRIEDKAQAQQPEAAARRRR
ncbi:hypothetical protein HDZ31DRAFT_28282 [Schizophyllum fasciatum]